jgi:hypothetical protein
MQVNKLYWERYEADRDTWTAFKRMATELIYPGLQLISNESGDVFGFHSDDGGEAFIVHRLGSEDAYCRTHSGAYVRDIAICLVLLRSLGLARQILADNSACFLPALEAVHARFPQRKYTKLREYFADRS